MEVLLEVNCCYWFLFTSCFAASDPDQAEQSRTEQPCGGRDRHGGDIAGAHSPRVVAGALTARALVAVAEVEVPRVDGNRRVLRAGPVAVGLDVRKQVVIGIMGRGNRLTRYAAQFVVEQMPHLTA